ncbi:MAG: hypothetical protein LBL49_10145 [Clostridiales Family XIII bacterium]|nr:hypothetical protein [Clostridiales Family XIII bacterium]
MPLVILGLLIIVGGILYVRYVQRDKDPSITPPTEAAPASEEHDAPEPSAGSSFTPGFAFGKFDSAVVAEPAGSADADESPASRISPDASAPNEADAPNFASMEELTEFYRKEAERITGIKH